MESTDFSESLRNYHRYRYETARIASFSRGNWPLSWDAAIRLAMGGFWHKSNGQVCCFDCELTINDWSEADDPSLVHTLHQYRRTMCRFARHLPCGNVPIDANPVPLPMPQPQDSIGVVGANANVLLRILGIDTMYKAEYPHFKHLSARLRSFDTWPVGIAQKRENLAAAGFVYFGVSDALVCYHCGVSLSGWEPNDDPWIEHSKKSPQCQHVIMTKGLDFINANVPAKDDTLDGNHHYDIALPNGVFVVETSSPTSIRISFVELSDSDDNDDHDDGDLSPNTTTDTPVDDDVDCQEDKSLCKICYNSPMNVVVLPCAHMATCIECLVSMTKCIICREPISHYVKVYVA